MEDAEKYSKVLKEFLEKLRRTSMRPCVRRSSESPSLTSKCALGYTMKARFFDDLLNSVCDISDDFERNW
jgi:hypothetical protein